MFEFDNKVVGPDLIVECRLVWRVVGAAWVAVSFEELDEFAAGPFGKERLHCVDNRQELVIDRHARWCCDSCRLMKLRKEMG